MKRVTAILLIIALLGCFAGCGETEAETSLSETAATAAALPETFGEPETAAPETEAAPADQTVTVGGVSIVVPGDYRHDAGSDTRQLYVSPSAKVQITLVLFRQSAEEFAEELGCESTVDIVQKIAADKGAQVLAAEETALNGRAAVYGWYASDAYGEEFFYLIPLEGARVHVVAHLSPGADAADAAAAAQALATLSAE